MTNYSPSPALLTHIKQSEGCKLKAYKCPAGVWTIGYGHTKGVKPTDRCTQAQADAWLKEDIIHHARLLSPHIKVSLTQAQMDALVDMVFNVGMGKVASSTLLRYINEKKPTRDIQAQFLRWDKANGRVLSGLTLRCKWRANRWVQ